MGNLLEGESVMVTGRTSDDDAAVFVERVEEKDGEDKDLVFESRLDIVVSEVNLALETVVGVLELGAILRWVNFSGWERKACLPFKGSQWGWM